MRRVCDVSFTGVAVWRAGVWSGLCQASWLYSEGATRERIASEAFLIRRLESLPDLAGRFRLNVSPPIPFDVGSRMVVDLFCAYAGRVIEIAGSQHLVDPDAYRRDRRKDALLQAHGYFLLRFLAWDSGKTPDRGLDTLLRTIASRSQRH